MKVYTRTSKYYYCFNVTTVVHSKNKKTINTISMILLLGF